MESLPINKTVILTACSFFPEIHNFIYWQKIYQNSILSIKASLESPNRKFIIPNFLKSSSTTKQLINFTLIETLRRHHTINCFTPRNRLATWCATWFVPDTLCTSFNPQQNMGFTYTLIVHTSAALRRKGVNKALHRHVEVGGARKNKSKQAGRAPTTTADRGSIQDAKPTWRNTHTRGTRVSYPCPCFCIQQTQSCSTCVVWLRNCSKSNSEIIKWTASSECMFTTRTCVEGPLVIEERRIESLCIFHQGSKFARCNFFLWFWLQLTEEGSPRLILLFLMWFNLQSLAKG